MSLVRGYRSKRERGEPTLPLINIVFLMLVFFLVAAQVARPLGADVQLVRTDDPDLVPPPDALLLAANGTLTFRGRPATPEVALAILAGEAKGTAVDVRLLPDGRSDASALLDVAARIRAAGAESVFVVAERAR